MLAVVQLSAMLGHTSASVKLGQMAVRPLSSSVQDVFIVSQARTPLGSFQGKLKGLTATQLGSHAIRGAVDRAGVPAELVEEAAMGCVVQSGLGQAPARQAALGAGLADTTPCTTVNKVCASGLKSIMMLSDQLALAKGRRLVVAGGMESLSNTPYTLARGDTKYGGVLLKDTCNVDALTDAYTGWHMGRCAEETAKKFGLTREEQDDYALLSYERQKTATEAGVFKGEILPIDVSKEVVSEDEEPAGHNPASLRGLRTYWGDTVGVGSSSKLADGAAAAVLANQDGIQELGLKPLAKIVGYNDAAQNPVDWPTTPAKGIKNLLDQHGLKPDDIAAWEINEAFAVVILAVCRLLNIGLDKVNMHGGAISIGHPFGMSGARICNHLAHSLQPGQYGVASLCNGGGGASTILLHKL